MTQVTTPTPKQQLAMEISAIISTLAETNGGPESSLYLALGMDMQKWQGLRGILIDSGMATSAGFFMTLTAKGQELARKIDDARKQA